MESHILVRKFNGSHIPNVFLIKNLADIYTVRSATYYPVWFCAGVNNHPSSVLKKNQYSFEHSVAKL